MANQLDIVVTTKAQGDPGQVGKQAGKDIADGLGKGLDKATTASKQAGAKIEGDLKAVAAKGTKAGKDLGADIGKGADKAAAETKQATGKIGKDLEGLGDAGKKAGKSLADGLADGLSDLGGHGGAAGGLLGSLSKGLSGAKGGFIGAGLLLGGLVMDGIQTAVERRKVGAMVAAQTGQAAGSAARMGSIAGDVFADNFGDSLEQVGEAMTAVFQNKLIDTGAADTAIQHVTEQILTVSRTMGEESDRVARAVHTMLVNGVARNVTQALDMIQEGTEQGLNLAGDLLDTVSEYSSMWRKAGLSGQEAFGLISQAVKSGARDTDYAADALKEFQIRAQDGSATTARGFQTLGMDAKKMGQMVAAGGEPAKQVLRDTLNALQSMPPSVARSTAAVDLFGTKAEDLGDALYHMDLDNAAHQFDGFAGSVQEAADRMAEGQTGAEKLGKGFENAKGDVGDFLYSLGSLGESDDMRRATESARQLQLAIEKWKSTGSTEWLDQVKKKFPELSAAIDDYVAKHQDEVASHEAVTASVQTEIDTLDGLINKQKEAAGVVLSARDAERAFQSAIDDASAAIKTNGKTHDDNTEKGRANNKALDDLAKAALDNADAMSKNGRSTQDVANKMTTARRRFIDTAVQMGYTRAQARSLANQLGLIPGNIRVNVTARTAAAAENIRAFKRALDNIPRTITTTTYVRGANIIPGGGSGHAFLAHGGVSHAAEGGPRGNMTVINEQGPEAVELPNGSRVMTAGATRAMAEAGAFSGGGGVMVDATLRAQGGADGAVATMLASLVRRKVLRLEVEQGGRTIGKVVAR